MRRDSDLPPRAMNTQEPDESYETVHSLMGEGSRAPKTEEFR